MLVAPEAVAEFCAALNAAKKKGERRQIDISPSAASELLRNPLQTASHFYKAPDAIDFRKWLREKDSIEYNVELGSRFLKVAAFLIATVDRREFVLSEGVRRYAETDRNAQLEMISECESALQATQIGLESQVLSGEIVFRFENLLESFTEALKDADRPLEFWASLLLSSGDLTRNLKELAENKFAACLDITSPVPLVGVVASKFHDQDLLTSDFKLAILRWASSRAETRHLIDELWAATNFRSMLQHSRHPLLSESNVAQISTLIADRYSAFAKSKRLPADFSLIISASSNVSAAVGANVVLESYLAAAIAIPALESVSDHFLEIGAREALQAEVSKGLRDAGELGAKVEKLELELEKAQNQASSFRAALEQNQANYLEDLERAQSAQIDSLAVALSKASAELEADFGQASLDLTLSRIQVHLRQIGVRRKPVVGETVVFDPAIHDSFSGNFVPGEFVSIKRSGFVYLKDGQEVLLIKAKI